MRTKKSALLILVAIVAIVGITLVIHGFRKPASLPVVEGASNIQPSVQTSLPSPQVSVTESEPVASTNSIHVSGGSGLHVSLAPSQKTNQTSK